MPLSSEPRISARGPFNADFETASPDFSLEQTTARPDDLRYSTARKILFSLQTGNVCRAPAEVLIASAVILADPFSGIIIAWAPRHSAVRTIAPKFLTSDTPSSTMTRGSSPFSKVAGRIFEIDWNSINDNQARTPW